MAYFKSATFTQRLAQARQSAYNSKRYTSSSYKIGNEVKLSKTLFADVSLTARPSQKLTVHKVGSFKLTKLVGRKAVKILLPVGTTIHLIIHTEHTLRVHKQPIDKSEPLEPQRQPIIDDNKKCLMKISIILSHRQRRKRWQFLTRKKNSPEHEAEWKPLMDFLDDNRPIMKALHTYA